MAEFPKGTIIEATQIYWPERHSFFVPQGTQMEVKSVDQTHVTIGFTTIPQGEQIIGGKNRVMTNDALRYRIELISSDEKTGILKCTRPKQQ